VKCPYCQGNAALVNGDDVYPARPDLHYKLFWACFPCAAWVGCHPNTAEPLGTLANAELRKLRSAAHAAFDPRWKSGKPGGIGKRRNREYQWLADQLGITVEQTHIGMFNAEMARRVVAICEAVNQD
jgi:hypothetical protein